MYSVEVIKSHQDNNKSDTFEGGKLMSGKMLRILALAMEQLI
jgi:hypothetical protein